MRTALRTGLTLTVTMLLLLAFNLVWVGKLPDIRWDFSREKIHTLSPQTQQFLTSLAHPLDLYYFNAHNAPTRTYALKRYGKRVEDLLLEYEKTAGGMINLHLIDPSAFSEDAYKAGLFGLDDTAGFMGLIGTRAGHGAQRIESFSLEREPLLEYEISHLIDKLQRPERSIIGLLPGLAMEETSGRLLKELQRHFNLVKLGANTERIPEHVNTLMVVHPRELSERSLYGIEQFVLKGGKLMMFIDPVTQQHSNTPLTHNRLAEVLDAWGIQMPADKFVADHRYAAVVPPQPGHPAMLHPGKLDLPRQALNAHDISSRNVSNITVSSGGAFTRRPNGRTNVTPLLQSSGQSALLGTDQLAVATEFDPIAAVAATQRQHHVIAARIDGPAYSVFPDGIEGQPPGVQTAAQINVVVIADTDLLTDEVISAAPNGNILFVLNTLDNLSASDALFSVRPRAPANSPLNVLERMRDNAANAYGEKAAELERRLLSTEQEWRRLSPPPVDLGSQAVDTTPQMVALNKERLRLPIELQALRAETYAQVRRVELALKLAVTLAIPLMLCLIAWVVFLANRRRRQQAGGLHL
ncbi:ABC transporter [Pseudomonas fluorescens ABAC62]|nr:ABC transporter [Pseudomonas fluorescens ABAC62]